MTSALPHARRLLEVVAAHLEEHGRTAPARRYVSPGGLSVWDEEQLTVSVPRPSIPGAVGQATGRARPVPGPRYCELRVELVRCVPALEVDPQTGHAIIPTAEALDAAAVELLEDASVLSQLTPAQVVGDENPGRPALLGTVTQDGPAGKMSAVSLLVQVPL